MSLVKVVAIEPCNEYRPGENFETTERQARQMIARGLVKMAEPVRNKMALPVANKASPTPAAGRALRSSALPVAPASPATTARSSGTGRPRGRPRTSDE